MASASDIYDGSNGVATRSFLRQLESTGQLGHIAAQLFRAQKASSRAKKYRGGIRRSNGSRTSYRSLSYDRKGQSLDRLCQLLDADGCGLTWGWGHDDKQLHNKFVLYVELPQGQVSFHSVERFAGPDYLGEKPESSSFVIRWRQLNNPRSCSTFGSDVLFS